MSKTKNSATAVDYDGEVEALDAINPTTHPGRSAAAFTRLVAARQLVEQADSELRAAVDAARAEGDSWTVIGAALGVSRQSAHERFGRR